MIDSAEALRSAHCQPLLPGTPALGSERAAALLAQLAHWTVEDGGIARTFGFRNHLETIAFVNAVAWLSHREDHHPDMHVTYDRCKVSYRTHSIGGLSENDFICAARLDALYGS